MPLFQTVSEHSLLFLLAATAFLMLWAAVRDDS